MNPLPIYDLPIDAEWPDGVDPKAWREMSEPADSDLDDDEDEPATDDVVDILGFDPDAEGW